MKSRDEVNRINAIKASKHTDLAAICALKIDQICQWRKEHIRYAGYIKNNTLNAETLRNFINNYNNVSMNHNIYSWIVSYSKNFDFYNIFLLDSIGNPLLSVDLSFPYEYEHYRDTIDEVIRTGEIVFSDLHVNSRGDIDIDIVMKSIPTSFCSR